MFDFINRNTSKIAMLVVSMLALSTIAVGGVAAISDTKPVDATIEPTNDTESVYVDVVGVDDFGNVTGFATSDTVDVSVTLTGMNSSDSTYNNTVVDSQTLTISEGSTSSYDYALAQSDIDDYDNLQLEVEVVNSGDEAVIDSVDWGALQAVGGAGGSLSLDSLGSIGGIPIAVIVIGLGVFLVYRGD